ncbi:helix-turn-helix domain-containing protein [Nocardiopsis halotolerans]|uniref:PucR family transcriptional regulator n=1 Tax=Nocardiopsis halotolerans TaxID=124252 RepID=UPI001268D481
MPRAGFDEVVAAHDRQHGTDHRRTLLSYLRNFGDVRGVGSESTLHENTVRKRVRRARELFGFLLDNPTRRLLLELELGAGVTETRVGSSGGCSGPLLSGTVRRCTPGSPGTPPGHA